MNSHVHGDGLSFRASQFPVRPLNPSANNNPTWKINPTTPPTVEDASKDLESTPNPEREDEQLKTAPPTSSQVKTESIKEEPSIFADQRIHSLSLSFISGLFAAPLFFAALIPTLIAGLGYRFAEDDSTTGFLDKVADGLKSGVGMAAFPYYFAAKMLSLGRVGKEAEIHEFIPHASLARGYLSKEEVNKRLVSEIILGGDQLLTQAAAFLKEQTGKPKTPQEYKLASEQAFTLLEQAERTFEDAWELDPNNNAIIFAIAKTLISMNSFKELDDENKTRLKKTSEIINNNIDSQIKKFNILESESKEPLNRDSLLNEAKQNLIIQKNKIEELELLEALSNYQRFSREHFNLSIGEEPNARIVTNAEMIIEALLKDLMQLEGKNSALEQEMTALLCEIYLIATLNHQNRFIYESEISKELNKITKDNLNWRIDYPRLSELQNKFGDPPRQSKS